MPKLYSEISEFYHELFPVNLSLIEFLKSEMKTGKDILDIGCGNGHITAAIARAGFNVVGSDIDRGMIMQARQKWPGVEFMVMDVTDLSSMSGGWDCICCLGNVISYLKSHQKQRLARDAFEKLNPGGLWLSQFVNWDAVIQTDQYCFPVKELPERNVVFNRMYHKISTKTVTFHSELKTPSKILRENAVLYPVTVETFKLINQGIGFELLGHWRDFNRSPYDSQTMTGNVFVWKKS